MKPHRELIRHPQNASWRFYLRELEALPFEWHYHPEYELTLTVQSSGERYIGDHIEPYSSGDLVLTGPNLPHSWASQPGLGGVHRVYVLWFRQQWVTDLARQFPEFEPLQQLFLQSHRGLAWSKSLATQLVPLFEQLPQASPARRSVLVLDIGLRLLEARPRALASTAFQSEVTTAANQRQLMPILDQLHREFRAPLNAHALAQQNHMSVSTLGRLFRQQMNQSLQQYLTHIRIGHACADLIRTDKPIQFIAENNGFSNLSNFNRLFKRLKNTTPRAFRAHYRAVGHQPVESSLAGPWLT